LVGAHSVLAAQLVATAGFDGAWVSSYELSMLNGHADANLLQPDQVLDVARRIKFEVSIPVFADCDTGYGHPRTVAYITRQFGAGQVDGVAFEDSAFPKSSSLYAQKKVLSEAGVFAECVYAASQSKVSGRPLVIARTEAFVAGLGLDEAMRRASLYAEAGADLIFVHSISRNADEVAAFAHEWRAKGRKTPLVAVPTTYSQVSAEKLYVAGFSIVIYANYLIRAYVSAARKVLAKLKQTGRGEDTNSMIATLTDMNCLVGLTSSGAVVE